MVRARDKPRQAAGRPVARGSPPLQKRLPVHRRGYHLVLTSRQDQHRLVHAAKSRGNLQIGQVGREVVVVAAACVSSDHCHCHRGGHLPPGCQRVPPVRSDGRPENGRDRFLWHRRILPAGVDHVLGYLHALGQLLGGHEEEGALAVRDGAREDVAVDGGGLVSVAVGVREAVLRAWAC